MKECVTKFWFSPLPTHKNSGTTPLLPPAKRFWSPQHLYTQLKADQSHPRNYPHTTTDYRHTDEHLRLHVMRLVMSHISLCCSAGRVQTNTQTNGRTDGRTLPILLSSLFAVDKNNETTQIMPMLYGD